MCLLWFLRVLVCLACRALGSASAAEHAAVDPVTKALEYVEQIAQQKNNCSFGPSLDLQYGKSRWTSQAEVAVRAANLLSTLSRTGNHMRGEHPEDEDLLYSIVISNVKNNDDVFGSAIAFQSDFYRDYAIFCPYAFRAPDQITAKDLSIGYNYTEEETDWFQVPFNSYKDYRLALLPETITSWAIDRLNDAASSSSMKFVDLSDGYWTKPYFDCGGGDVWMVTFSVPFFWADLDPSGLEYFTFAGVTTIDISLDYLDIYQCPIVNNTDHSDGGDSEIFDPFVGTDHCKNTTKCTHIPGLGFQRGAYRCECKPGYYFPVDNVPTYLLDVDNEEHRAFSGSAIEAEYNKKVYGEDNLYDSAFDCLPCPDGCEDCVDASPCFAEPNVVLRWSLLAVNTLGMVMLLILAFYTYRLRENRVFKAASPGLLYVILVGTGICYCQTIVAVVLSLNIITCQVLNWCRYIGFCLAYGALLYKTWRITKVFTVRSAKPVRITDNNLYARIGILLAVCAVYLSAWTFLDPSTPTLGYKEDGLKFYECSRSTWDYVGQGGEFLLLGWGIYLCIKVRKAPSSFNESRFISVSIYNETLINIFGAIIQFVLPEEVSGPDSSLLIDFSRVHLTFTVMTCLIFVSKVKYFPEYRTNSPKKKTLTSNSGRKTPLVFTIDTSEHKIEFTYENREVSDELSRMRRELVDIKEIAKLAPVNRSIVNRYKLGISKNDQLCDPSSTVVLQSRGPLTRETGHEDNPCSTPLFLKKIQKGAGNPLAGVVLHSLSGRHSKLEIPRNPDGQLTLPANSLSSAKESYTKFSHAVNSPPSQRVAREREQEPFRASKEVAGRTADARGIDSAARRTEDDTPISVDDVVCGEAHEQTKLDVPISSEPSQEIMQGDEPGAAFTVSALHPGCHPDKEAPTTQQSN
ncbi:metabotropic glycine receptor-like [Diadema setosum]|uniref:metabotropic glycine receptor-like n=1 Tax=Diadema setosum TaxID=31175 RepID=UPI003B3A767A